MKSLSVVLFVFAVLFFPLCGKSFAQADAIPNRGLDDEGPHQKMDPSYTNEWPRPYSHGTVSVARSKEARVLKKGTLAPALTDRLTLATFLREPDTGLVRLLPRERYDNPGAQQLTKVKLRGGGAYFSFADLTHAYGYGSDIELDRNTFSVGFARADYGMLTNLGDVRLDELSERYEGAQFLINYPPPRDESLARAEARRFANRNGVKIDNAIYYRRLPVVENSTYLLRSISYGHSDLLVAFRVVRKDSDESVTIAWKLLKRFRPPDLITVRRPFSH
jgi:hypothetical protein